MGLATAKTFADAGAAVVLVDIHEEAIRAVSEQFVASGHKSIAIACDVTDEVQVKSMVEQAVSAFGRLDARSTTLAFRVWPSKPLTQRVKSSIVSTRLTSVAFGSA
jgi:NAD(P)-dependent dehydrogenase (short-subunit alcohol dehydrogenase family)